MRLWQLTFLTLALMIGAPFLAYKAIASTRPAPAIVKEKCRTLKTDSDTQRVCREIGL